MAKVPVRCPECGRGGSVDESYLGKRIRCKKCDTSFVLALAQDEAGDASSSAPGGASPGSAGAEDGVPLTWSPGDVILDLYEVKPFDPEKDYAEGGMGRVYRVHHRGCDLDIAVKS